MTSWENVAGIKERAPMNTAPRAFVANVMMKLCRVSVFYHKKEEEWIMNGKKQVYNRFMNYKVDLVLQARIAQW